MNFPWHKGEDAQTQRVRIVVYGAGGHSKIVLATILAGENKYEIAALLDDDTSKSGTSVYDYPVLGGREQLTQLRNQGITQAVVAVGDNFKRVELAQVLTEYGFQLATLIHPTVTRLLGSRVGAGTVVSPHAFIGADVSIGDNVIVNTASVVGHDCVVGNGAHIASKATLGGNVRVGDCSLIGMGAAILPQVIVGQRVIVGANAAVVDSLPDDVTAVGVPARIIRRRGIQ